MAIPSSRQQFKYYCAHTKYGVWYFALVEKAALRGWTKDTAPCYVEGHHVVPRSLGGTDEDVVYLTAREHFICHMLLPRIVSGPAKYKMNHALNAMKRTSENQNRYFNSALYESARKNLKFGPQTEEHKRKRLQQLIGRKHSDDARQKMSANCPKNSLGKKWFHDPIGKTQKYFIPGQQPTGFIQGRR